MPEQTEQEIIEAVKARLYADEWHVERVEDVIEATIKATLLEVRRG